MTKIIKSESYKRLMALDRVAGPDDPIYQGGLARLPLFAAIFPIFDALCACKCLIDMAWEWTKPSKHAVVPTLPLA